MTERRNTAWSVAGIGLAIGLAACTPAGPTSDPAPSGTSSSASGASGAVTCTGAQGNLVARRGIPYVLAGSVGLAIAGFVDGGSRVRLTLVGAPTGDPTSKAPDGTYSSTVELGVGQSTRWVDRTLHIVDICDERVTLEVTPAPA